MRRPEIREVGKHGSVPDSDPEIREVRKHGSVPDPDRNQIQGYIAQFV